MDVITTLTATLQVASISVATEPGLPVKLDTTRWSLNKMADILQKKFSNAFFWMKNFNIGMKFRWDMFVKGVIDKTTNIVSSYGLLLSDNEP